MLYDFLKGYQAKDIYPFHMPGHKRNPAFLPPDLISLDVTEFDGTDNLHAPEGPVKKLQEKISSMYSSDDSFMLVNGSSSGIVAAMCASFREGEEVYIDRGCHQSVFHGLALCGATPVYEFNEHTRNAVTTSPSYEGFTKDVQTIADTVHANGGVLIVDEAHGAHFPFHKIFPMPAMTRGADISVNSFHKTLPGLSQTAALHVKGGRVDRDKLKFYLRVVQTSSPSYIFMAATDFMLDMLNARPELFEEYVAELTRVRAEIGSVCLLSRRPGVSPSFRSAFADTSSPKHPDASGNRISTRRYPRSGVNFDIGKLLFKVGPGMSGYDVMALMAEKYRVQLEMATDTTILAMTSVADTREGFDRLLFAVSAINKNVVPMSLCEAGSDAFMNGGILKTVPELVLTPREALNRETEPVKTSEAEGRVAAEFVAKYPPGIPILVPGERIAKEMLKDIVSDCVKTVKRR